jgi:hypothetical protein
MHYVMINYRRSTRRVVFLDKKREEQIGLYSYFYLLLDLFRFVKSLFFVYFETNFTHSLCATWARNHAKTNKASNPRCQHLRSHPGPPLSPLRHPPDQEGIGLVHVHSRTRYGKHRRPFRSRTCAAVRSGSIVDSSHQPARGGVNCEERFRNKSRRNPQGMSPTPPPPPFFRFYYFFFRHSMIIYFLSSGFFLTSSSFIYSRW